MPAAPSDAPSPEARRKAAIVVQFLLADGARPPLATLPEEAQVALAREMRALGVVDRATLDAVLAEFADQLESVGLAPPAGAEAALSALQGVLSPTALQRARAEAGRLPAADPWAAVAALPPRDLARLLGAESVEVAAVALSKLPAARAAEALALLPGERARRVAHAVSRTQGVTPEVVGRIGRALAGEWCAAPPAAFPQAPGERLGAILNTSPQAAREALLGGIEAEDQDFAAEVRRAIFTFAHLPRRLRPADVPRVLRGVEARTVAVALFAARAGTGGEAEAAEFLLASIPQRLADSLREEVAALGRVKPAEGEAAQGAVVAAVRERAEAGEIELVEEEEG